MHNQVVDIHNEFVHGYYRIKQKFNNNIGKKEEENKKIIVENLKLQEIVNKLEYSLIESVRNSGTFYEKTLSQTNKRRKFDTT